MKYAIWGTGKYYEKYKCYINAEDVLFLIDNDKDKWGEKIDGKEILAPEQADYEKCDFVLIMIIQYEEVEQQLLSYGLSKDKIKSYHNILELYDIKADIVSGGSNISFEKWKKNHQGKKIFMCSNEFSRTGVPVAMMNTCTLLMKMGFEVLLSALLGGALEEEFEERGIDYLTDIGIFYKEEWFLNILKEFDLIFIGGLSASDFSVEVSKLDLPIIFWLHESYDVYYEKYKLIIRDNIHYYAGGKRVLEKFYEHYPSGRIEEMLYFLPQIEEMPEVRKSQEKIMFAVLGSISKRKGQDIFIEAIKQIEEEKQKKANFVMVGSYSMADNFFDFDEQIKKIDNCKWIDELNQKELALFYKEIDVLVCPSRDDPMPIVVTQAFQNGIPCIISDQVGQCEYIKVGKGGEVFHSEDVKELKNIMIKYIDDKEALKVKSLEAKQIFLQHFSEDAMRKHLDMITSILIER